jgi:plastocyanin domain-containing protein
MPTQSLLALIVLSLSLGVACSKTQAEEASKTQETAQAANEPNGDATIIPIIANETGFAPSRVEVRVGSKTTLRFKRTTDSTCATAVAFPELGLTKPLPLGQDVDIAVPSEHVRTLTFQCGMGMYKSSVVVN